jgi:hypothetical protein
MAWPRPCEIRRSTRHRARSVPPRCHRSHGDRQGQIIGARPATPRQTSACRPTPRTGAGPGVARLPQHQTRGPSRLALILAKPSAINPIRMFIPRVEISPVLPGSGQPPVQNRQGPAEGDHQAGGPPSRRGTPPAPRTSYRREREGVSCFPANSARSEANAFARKSRVARMRAVRRKSSCVSSQSADRGSGIVLGERR